MGNCCTKQADNSVVPKDRPNLEQININPQQHEIVQLVPSPLTRKDSEDTILSTTIESTTSDNATIGPWKQSIQLSKLARKTLPSRVSEDFYSSTDPEASSKLKELIRKARDEGDAQSQYTLAYCYDTGDLVTAPDTAKAIHWYTLAAEQNHPEALNNLGVLLITGHNGNMAYDLKAAQKWFIKGAEVGDRDCQFHAALSFLQEMSEEGKLNEELEEKALEYFKSAADQGLPQAMVNTAVLALENAMRRKVKKRRSTMGKTLGTVQEEGRKCIRESEALEMLIKAADDLGDPLAQHNLGVIYKFGLFGGKRDTELYKKYIRLAMSEKNQGTIPKSLSRKKRDDGTLMKYTFT